MRITPVLLLPIVSSSSRILLVQLKRHTAAPRASESTGLVWDGSESRSVGRIRERLELFVCYSRFASETCPKLRRVTKITPPAIFPSVAEANQVMYVGGFTKPDRTALKISPLLAMQCANCPMPTTTVSAQMTTIWPMGHELPETIQAISAMIHPPITPLQKTCTDAPATAARPSETSSRATSGCRAPVFTASTAKIIAPMMLQVNTKAHRRNVFSRCRRSLKTSATG